jgi:hypothetical protein
VRWLPVCVAALVLAAPSAALARSVRDSDIGWSESLRRELRLERPRTSACKQQHVGGAAAAVQTRLDRNDPIEALRSIFRYRWGNAWFDLCDRGRLKIGVPPKPTKELRHQLGRARALLERRHQTRDVRFVAVRSTYRELSDAQETLSAPFEYLFDQGLISPGIDTTLNAVAIDVARPVHGEDWKRLRTAARQAPVNVVLHRVAADNLFFDPA